MKDEDPTVWSAGFIDEPGPFSSLEVWMRHLNEMLQLPDKFLFKDDLVRHAKEMVARKIDNATSADAMKTLVEMFSRLPQGKSRFSGIRYEPKIEDGKIIFVPNADDIAFEEAFNSALETFESDKD